MALYSYTIRNKNGQQQTGSLNAENPEAAARTVAKPGWFVVSVKTSRDTGKDFALFSQKPSMSTIEKITFTDHLGEMIGAGTPLIEALETYIEEDHKKNNQIIRDLISSVSQGSKLSEALHMYPKIFSAYYTSLVTSGELTGKLDESFTTLAKELRREHEFKERIRSALIYPILVLIVAFLVIVLLVFLVIPKITELTKSFGGDLPLATRIVSGASVFIVAYGGWLIGAFVLLVAAFMVAMKNPQTRKQLEPSLYRMPLVGGIMRQYMLARFLRVIGSCLSYGVPMTVAFDTVSNIVGQSLYRDASLRLKDKVVHGRSFAEALKMEDPFYFPSFITRSVRGAEKTGSLDKAFLRIALFYENEVDRNLHRLTELIQPLLTVVLGLIVAAIALAVVAPIYQITSKIR